MKFWKISFQYWSILFVNQNMISSPIFASMSESMDQTTRMDDDNLDACFEKLCEGNNVVVICHHSIRRVVQYCMSKYRYVKAAGGIVEEPSGCRLLIYRNERWDLPKGKVEEGETLKEAAVREVMEESGMHDISVGALADKTYHIFNLYGGWHLKQTSWFYMNVPDKLPINVQTEEGITNGEWTEKEEWNRRLSSSYATMRQLCSL